MGHYLTVGYDVQGAGEREELDLLGWVRDEDGDEHEDEAADDEDWIEEDRVVMVVQRGIDAVVEL